MPIDMVVRDALADRTKPAVNGPMSSKSHHSF